MFVTIFAFLPAGRQVFLPSRQICNGCCTRTPHQCSQSNSCTMTQSWLRCKLVPRHCANVHLQTFCNHDNFPATYQTCTATLVMLKQICAWTAKNAPYPPCLPAGKACTVTVLSAKLPVPCPVLVSGNATSHYCRAVSDRPLITLIKDSFILFFKNYLGRKVYPLTRSQVTQTYPPKRYLR